MTLQELFHHDDVLVGFSAQDKWDALQRLMGHLESTGRVEADLAPALLEAILEREKSMSTGMERGLAIPHAAVDGIDSVRACLAICGPEGLNFESIDGGVTRIIVLLLIPRSEKLIHIRTLATVARVLGDEDVRRGLFAAQTGEEAWHVLEETAG